MCDRQNEDSGMSACGPSSEKRTDRQLRSRRRGEASVEMTAQDILSLAVNVAQNDWPLDTLRCGATKSLDASGRRLDSGRGPPLPSDPVVTVSASRRYTIGALRVSSPHPRDYMDLGAASFCAPGRGGCQHGPLQGSQLGHRQATVLTPSVHSRKRNPRPLSRRLSRR